MDATPIIGEERKVKPSEVVSHDSVALSPIHGACLVQSESSWLK